MIFFTYIPYDSTILIHFAWWTDPFSTAFPHETRDLFEGSWYQGGRPLHHAFLPGAAEKSQW
jgi:hypothetical protein